MTEPVGVSRGRDGRDPRAEPHTLAGSSTINFGPNAARRVKCATLKVNRWETAWAWQTATSRASWTCLPTTASAATIAFHAGKMSGVSGRSGKDDSKVAAFASVSMTDRPEAVHSERPGGDVAELNQVLGGDVEPDSPPLMQLQNRLRSNRVGCISRIGQAAENAGIKKYRHYSYRFSARNASSGGEIPQSVAMLKSRRSHSSCGSIFGMTPRDRRRACNARYFWSYALPLSQLLELGLQFRIKRDAHNVLSSRDLTATVRVNRSYHSIATSNHPHSSETHYFTGRCPHGIGIVGGLRWRSRRTSLGRSLNQVTKRTSCLTASS